jgi:4a-hydroxytetrahydrobiopterin dehydratase
MEQNTKKKCVPCEGIGRPFSYVEVKHRKNEIPGWELAPDAKSIERTLTLKNFVECVELINQIKDIAESENHHPDVHLTGYKNLKIVLSTHAVGGVTENDFILASRINELI